MTIEEILEKPKTMITAEELDKGLDAFHKALKALEEATERLKESTELKQRMLEMMREERQFKQQRELLY